MFKYLADDCVITANETNGCSFFMPLACLEANEDKSICNEKLKNEYEVKIKTNIYSIRFFMAASYTAFNRITLIEEGPLSFACESACSGTGKPLRRLPPQENCE